MFRMKRRLLAVAALSALALSQVLPVSAGSVGLSYGSGSGSGTSTQGSPSFGSTYVSPSCGYQGLRLYYYDAGLGYFVARSWMDGASFYYFDSVPASTLVHSDHRIGTSYSGGFYNEFYSSSY